MATKPTLGSLVSEIPALHERLAAAVVANEDECIVHIRHADPSLPIDFASLSVFLKTIGDVAAYSPSVSAFWLHRALLDADASSTVASFLTTNTAFRTPLKFIGFDDEAAIYPARSDLLGRLLPALRSVAHVSLRFNNLGDEHIPILFPALKSPTMQVLDLSGNTFSSAGTAEIIKLATYTLPKLRHLLFTLSPTIRVDEQDLQGAIEKVTRGHEVAQDAWPRYRRQRYEVCMAPIEAARLDVLLQRLDDARAGKKVKKGEELTEAELAASEWEKGVTPAVTGTGFVVPAHPTLTNIQF